MKKIYFAARYRHRADLLVMASELEAEGHEVTARWIQGLHEEHPDYECAVNDEADVRQSDVLVFFSEKAEKGDRGGGGRHVEFGMAYALGKTIVVVGPQENLFHSLPGVIVAKDWHDAKRAIRASGNKSRESN